MVDNDIELISFGLKSGDWVNIPLCYFNILNIGETKKGYICCGSRLISSEIADKFYADIHWQANKKDKDVRGGRHKVLDVIKSFQNINRIYIKYTDGKEKQIGVPWYSITSLKNKWQSVGQTPKGNFYISIIKKYPV